MGGAVWRMKTAESKDGNGKIGGVVDWGWGTKE